MWMFMSAVVICFTIIVLFRIFLDLRRQEQQHIRLMQSDRIQHGKYLEVTSRETKRELPKAQMPDLSGSHSHTYEAMRKLQEIRAAERHVRTWSENEKPKPWIDPRMSKLMGMSDEQILEQWDRQVQEYRRRIR